MSSGLDLGNEYFIINKRVNEEVDSYDVSIYDLVR